MTTGTRPLRLYIRLAILAATVTLASCAMSKADDDVCLDTGLHFELSKRLMSDQDMAKAVAAMDMALAELGFTQSHDVVDQFDAIKPSAAIKLVTIHYGHTLVLRDKAWIPAGPSDISIEFFGVCGPKAQNERRNYAASIKSRLEASLQPYAAEQVAATVSTFIEVD